MKRVYYILLFVLLAVRALAADRLTEADRLYHESSWQLDSGRVDKAQEGLLRAADLYRQCRGQDTKVSLCLYQLSIAYFNQRDLPAMRPILGRMQRLARQHAKNVSIQYDYYSVLGCYEAALYEEQPSDSLRAAMTDHFRRSLHFQEQMSPQEWTDKKLNPVRGYMNMATLFDMMYDPPLTDSTRLYVEKARAANRKEWGSAIDHQDADVTIRDMQAWLCYYDHRYAEAEREMLGVVALIDSLQPMKGNTMLTERLAAYEFLAMLYEDTNRPTEALRYQKLMTETHRQRFDVEKNTALHEVEARYEAEKKDEAIRHLNAENRALLLLVIILVLAVVMGIGLWLYRRRLRENRLYTEALQAETEQQAEHTSLSLLADQLGITGVNLAEAQALMRQSVKPLTVVDQKYMLCFLAGESVKRIAARFNVEPASVYTVRYRLKRKFPQGQILPF